MGVEADGQWKRNWNKRLWVVCQHVDLVLLYESRCKPPQNESKSASPHPYTHQTTPRTTPCPTAPPKRMQKICEPTWSKNPYSPIAKTIWEKKSHSASVQEPSPSPCLVSLLFSMCPSFQQPFTFPVKLHTRGHGDGMSWNWSWSLYPNGSTGPWRNPEPKYSRQENWCVNRSEGKRSNKLYLHRPQIAWKGISHFPQCV